MEFIPNDRHYESFYFKKDDSNFKLDINVNKLLYQDKIDKNGIIKNFSKYRTENIYGIIILNGTTHGRNKKNKLFYKFIPFVKQLPIFLVAIADQTSFSKLKINKFACCKFSNWDSKHPICTLVETIGDITEHQNYLKYQLCCLNLNFSLTKFNKCLKDKYYKQFDNDNNFISLISSKYKFPDRRSEHIFSIDPIDCKDIDDAISHKVEGKMNIISVYISNVSIILEYLNLWDSLNGQVSTIYLSDKKRPMIPFLLSDNLCSLLENRDRLCIALDIYIDNDYQINNTKFQPCLINISKNYHYDDPLLFENTSFNIIKNLILNNNLLNHENLINLDSHKVIEILMMYYNKEVANKLSSSYPIIYKSMKFNNTEDIPMEINHFMKGYGGYGSFYTTEKFVHEGINKSLYCQTTSPIRRIVDLINISYLNLFCEIKLINLKNLRIVNINELNQQTKLIKNIQSQDNLMMIFNEKCIDKLYESFIIEIFENKIIIFIPSINKIFKIKTNKSYYLYQKVTCKLYLFKYEYDINKKIRASLI